MRSPLKSNRGQIAVFLILIFQVLFVFFAMSMNIGMVVYDKVNLQNSADISAYYAAQKQAELLNQIAHINYQMRQAYKLLTFRLRVIGSVSIGIGPEARLAPHPIRVGPDFGKEGTAFFEKPIGKYVPAVCIGSSLWHEYKITEQNATVSLCQNLTQFSAVPPIKGSGDPFGFTSGLNTFLDRIRGEIEEKCKVVGVLNWQLAASWLYAYAHEAKVRKEMIDQIAGNMSLPAADMKDFTGQSVMAGAQKTLTKNLTAPQRDALVEFKLINSLSSDVSGPCNDKAYWLPNIDILPVVAYVSMIWQGYSCETRVATSRGNAPPLAYTNMVGGRDNALLRTVWNSDLPISYGVEKNPWCMPYMGVQVSTQPRKIFSPFGAPPTLKAEAYAKPFGGRIGPWYGNQWSAGARASNGSKVDPLLPARSVDGNRQGGAPQDDIVNHSKYPGDQNGMNSAYALGVMNKHYLNMTGGAPPNALPSIFALAFYNHVGNPVEFEAQGDSLARPNGLASPPGLKVRYMEEAAVIPDIFDITYYSIDAQYSYNYYHNNLSQFRSFVEPHYVDIGSQNRGTYGIINQMSRSVTEVFGNKSQVPFYMLAEPDNLLTGWTQNKAVNYDFPNTFGKCLQRRDGEMEATPSPGGCPHGGRSGYSVKVVSQAYLRKVSADLGGPGNTGPILNPPPGGGD